MIKLHENYNTFLGIFSEKVNYTNNNKG